MSTHTVSRRDFVVMLTATGGGLMLGWRVSDRSRTVATAAAAPPAFAPNAFIRIGRDGRVTMIIGQVEMGQGMYTAMPMLLAEELEVGLDQVQLELLREEHGHRSVHALPHFDLPYDHGDAAVPADANERVRREAWALSRRRLPRPPDRRPASRA